MRKNYYVNQNFTLINHVKILRYNSSTKALAPTFKDTDAGGGEAHHLGDVLDGLHARVTLRDLRLHNLFELLAEYR